MSNYYEGVKKPDRYQIQKLIEFAAEEISSSELILDAGSGKQQYKKYFSHAEYESTDIVKLSGSEHDFICSLDDNSCPVKGSERTLEVDLICLAVGLSPLAELCWVAGCKFKHLPELGGFVPTHDESMRTTVSHLYVAGDVAGVEEASSAMEEGKLAGVGIAEDLGHLEEDEAKKSKEEIRRRIGSLRLGPFGHMRAKAKLELMKAGVQI